MRVPGLLKLLAGIAVVAALVATVVFQQRQTRLADPRLYTGDRTIVMLATSWCGYCKRLRAALDAAGVEYRVLDVEDGGEGEKAYHAVGGRGVPVTVIGQDVVHGYNAPRLTSLLRSLGHEVRLN